MPGVTSVGLTSNVPFNGNVASGSYAIVGYTPGAGEAAPHGRQEVVGADYFKAMQIPLIEGRLFTDGDTADSQPVVVVDKYLADKYFAKKSAVGQQIRRGGPQAPPSRSSASSGRSTASISGCQSRKNVSTIPSPSSRGRRWR